MRCEYTHGCRTSDGKYCKDCGLPLSCPPTVTVSTEMGPEMVNHPAHYGGKDNPFEHCKVARAWRLGANLYNATKYMVRAGTKDETTYVEDLKKARWYLDQEIDGQYDLLLKNGQPEVKNIQLRVENGTF